MKELGGEVKRERKQGMKGNLGRKRVKNRTSASASWSSSRIKAEVSSSLCDVSAIYSDEVTPNCLRRSLFARI